MKRFFFVLGILFLAAAAFWAFFHFSGGNFRFEPKTETSVTESRPRPHLATMPQTMDFTRTQKTAAEIATLKATNPNTDFLMFSVPSELPTVKRGHVEFDPAVSVNEKTLHLRGVTVRKFEMSAVSLLTIYTVGFYVDAKEDVETEIADTEKALVLQYHLDVDKAKVIEAIQENIYTNPKVDAKTVEPYFHQLSDAFDSPRKGDRYEFVYIPGRGTAMIKFGKILTVIPSREFEQAFFGIWLSPHGKDLDMRCELLALPCPEKASLNPVNMVSSGIGGAKEKLGRLKSLVS